LLCLPYVFLSIQFLAYLNYKIFFKKNIHWIISLNTQSTITIIIKLIQQNHHLIINIIQ
jgi:hypothetical protein